MAIDAIEHVLAANPAGEWFGVVDGARFSDCPALLKKFDLRSRSLFLDTAEEDVRRAGPWLICMSDSGASSRLEKAVDSLAYCVFWRCSTGELPLFKQLRKLNFVQLPDGDRVMFRHYDPRVMIVMARNLEIHQEGAFFGPAEELLVYEQRFVKGCLDVGRGAQ